MRVLDLFSGLGGWSAAFRERGHGVVTIDLDYRFNPTYCRDIMQVEDLDRFGRFDIILASPPCDTFSVASAYLHWKGGRPATSRAVAGIALARHAFSLIERAAPAFYAIENPVGNMRRIFPKPAATIDQCAYGRAFKKPTDLWGRLPGSFAPKRCSGKECGHYVGRGGLSNVVRDSSARALIPYGLSLAMCEAAERDL